MEEPKVKYLSSKIAMATQRLILLPNLGQFRVVLYLNIVMITVVARPQLQGIDPYGVCVEVQC